MEPSRSAQHGSLRTDDLAEVDDLLLDVRDVPHDLLRAALEDLVLDGVELVADLAEHREAVVEGVVDEPVEQIARALGEVLLARLLLRAAALEEVRDRLQGLVRDRDQVVAADEDVQLTRVQALHRVVVHREVKDDEEVVGVLVDLRPLVAGEHVLEVQRVEVEVLLEPAHLELRGVLDVNPAQALAVDRLDVGLALALWLSRLRGAARSGRPGAAWASEGSASAWLDSLTRVPIAPPIYSQMAL